MTKGRINLSYCKLPITQHNDEIHENLKSWNSKPLLREIYRSFHQEISRYLRHDLQGEIIELGSGIGSIKEIIPHCLCTDIFPNPWIDRVENIYHLSFVDNEVSNIIMIDVFHHISHPGTALSELSRVLCKNGRLIIFEPYVSLLGWLVYGLLHNEPISMNKDIEWIAPDNYTSGNGPYYAAQGNASRIFGSNRYSVYLKDWNRLVYRRMSYISYIASGGFSKPQLYPLKLLPLIQQLDSFLDLFPKLFASRMLVVLEKR